VSAERITHHALDVAVLERDELAAQLGVARVERTHGRRAGRGEERLQRDELASRLDHADLLAHQLKRGEQRQRLGGVRHQRVEARRLHLQGGRRRERALEQRHQLAERHLARVELHRLEHHAHVAPVEQQPQQRL
jgi:hypothetical protein